MYKSAIAILSVCLLAGQASAQGGGVGLFGSGGGGGDTTAKMSMEISSLIKKVRVKHVLNLLPYFKVLELLF
jgi:hypothetical protein